MTAETTVLIADDHPIFLNGLKDIIDSDPGYTVVAAAQNGEQAVKCYQQTQPALVVLDINMPLMDGLEAARKLKEINPLVPIAILTMHNSQGPFDKAMEIGVQGYVLKENAILDLLNCLAALRGGSKFVSPHVAKHFTSQKRNVENIREKLQSLTRSEMRILRLIGNYKTSQQIADELFVTRKTISNHRNNINSKLELKGNHSLLRFAIEYGEVLADLITNEES